MDSHDAATQAVNLFTLADVEDILRGRRWLTGEASADLRAWMESAAALLGPQAADRAALENLLELVFCYDARLVLASADAHTVLAREGAREVVRALAWELLAGGEMDSDRFKAVVEALKERVPYRSRALFHPLRLALTGRCGEGELDRVILLLDRAARLPFVVPVKDNRTRVMEFCAALD